MFYVGVFSKIRGTYTERSRQYEKWEDAVREARREADLRKHVITRVRDESAVNYVYDGAADIEVPERFDDELSAFADWKADKKAVGSQGMDAWKAEIGGQKPKGSANEAAAAVGGIYHRDK